MISEDGLPIPSPVIPPFPAPTPNPNPNPNPNPDPSPPASIPSQKRKRSLPGTPDPSAEVVALSPASLMATNRFLCEICGKGFQRDQNLQLHRRGHNLPWKLRTRAAGEDVRKKVYVCPEKTCVHHHPSRALGDLTGIKKHFSRKHGEKKWKCGRCSKKYAVQSDWKAHGKVCGTKEYRCDCGTLFSRKDSFVTHRAFCDALADESARFTTANTSFIGSNPMVNSSAAISCGFAPDTAGIPHFGAHFGAELLTPSNGFPEFVPTPAPAHLFGLPPAQQQQWQNSFLAAGMILKQEEESHSVQPETLLSYSGNDRRFLHLQNPHHAITQPSSSTPSSSSSPPSSSSCHQNFTAQMMGCGPADAFGFMTSSHAAAKPYAEDGGGNDDDNLNQLLCDLNWSNGGGRELSSLLLPENGRSNEAVVGGECRGLTRDFLGVGEGRRITAGDGRAPELPPFPTMGSPKPSHRPYAGN